MPNITLSIKEELLKKAREKAQKSSISLNTLVRKLLEEHVREDSDEWLEAIFSMADKSKSGSRGKRWNREDLYG